MYGGSDVPPINTFNQTNTPPPQSSRQHYNTSSYTAYTPIAVETTRPAEPAAPSMRITIRRNDEYVRSFPSIVRIVRMVCHIIGFICVSSASVAIAHGAGYLWARYLYQAFTIYGLLMALTTFVLFYLNLSKWSWFGKIDWLTIDILYCIEMAVIFFILSIACCLWERELSMRYILIDNIRVIRRRGGPAFAAFVGFIASGSYVAELIWKYMKVCRS